MNTSKISLFIASAIVTSGMISMFIIAPIDMLMLCAGIAFFVSILRVLYYFLNERDYD